MSFLSSSHRVGSSEDDAREEAIAASCLPASREALCERDNMAQSNLLEFKGAGNWGREWGVVPMLTKSPSWVIRHLGGELSIWLNLSVGEISVKN